jgi:hypothetical protein
MKATPNRAWISGRFVLAIALVAVAIRLIVPAGYMAGDGGGPPIVLCAAEDLMVSPASQALPGSPDGQSGDGDHSTPSGGDHPCAFAGVASPITTPSSNLAAPVIWTAARTQSSSTDYAFPGRGLAAPPPPQTGPPLTI